MRKKKVEKTKAELEKAIEDGFGTWEIDVREVQQGTLQLLIVDKGTYFVIALRLIDTTKTPDELRKEISASLKNPPIPPKKITYKKGPHTNTLISCAQVAQVPHEIVTKFVTIPTIIRELNMLLPGLAEDTEEQLPPMLSPFWGREPFAPAAPFEIPKFNKHGPYNAVCRFKVSLMHAKPTIWRRIEVPKTYTFFELAVAILNAMGWEGSHLHGFSIAQKGTARTINIQIPHPENFGPFPEDDRNELEERIQNYFGVQVTQCVFCYDFGDNWDHVVLFEGEFPKEEGVSYPRCTAGKNACPPDDCGGVGGYEELQHIIKNPRHPEHQDMLEWLCVDHAEDFDPTAFVLQEVDFEEPEEYYEDLKKWGFFG